MWNETYGHVFVLVKVEQDPGIFLKANELLMNKHSLLFGPKVMNFVVFVGNEEECSGIDHKFDIAAPMDLYVTIDSNALGYVGHSNPLARFGNRLIYEVGES